jgi:hypothetical protein
MLFLRTSYQKGIRYLTGWVCNFIFSRLVKIRGVIEIPSYIVLAVGIILIIFSFHILINQYRRALISRLGKNEKQVEPVINSRFS